MRDLRTSPFGLMLVGLLLLIVGAVLPFVMFLRFIEATLTLIFVSYIASVLGLAIGLYGVFEYYKSNKKKKEGRG